MYKCRKKLKLRIPVKNNEAKHALYFSPVSSSQQQWAMLLNCPSFKMYKDFAQYCTTYGIGKKGSDVIPAAGQAFTCQTQFWGHWREGQEQSAAFRKRMLTQVTWCRVTQQFLSLADSLSKNGSLLLDGHCTFPPLCWSPGQSFSKENGGTVAWVSRSSAVTSTSISICKMHHALPTGFLVTSACDTTMLRLLICIQNCLAAVPYTTLTSVSCLSQITAVLPVTCENFQKVDTQRYVSKRFQIMVVGYSCPLSRCVTLGRLGQI